MPRRQTQEEFIKKANEVHNNFYDYSKVVYVNNRTKVCIICPKHGEFWQTPDPHCSRKQGCPICRYEKSKQSIRKIMGLTKETFIEKAKKVHGDKYDYSKVEYENTDTNVTIICPEHGEFKQTPHHHLGGSGCPICGRNDLSEHKLLGIIKENFDNVVSQYRPSFLKNNGKSKSLDIYLPIYNIAIEYQGRQHFEPVLRYGGMSEFEKQVKRDKEKYKKCKENGIKLLYFSYERNVPSEYIDKIFTSEEEIIKTIRTFKQ